MITCRENYLLIEEEVNVEIAGESERPGNEARNKEVRQTPERKPSTQIWQGNELPICRALCETTLSRDL